MGWGRSGYGGKGEGRKGRDGETVKCVRVTNHLSLCGPIPPAAISGVWKGGMEGTMDGGRDGKGSTWTER